MQYHLWFVLLGLLAVPFFPFHFVRLPQLFSWLGSLRKPYAQQPDTISGNDIVTNLNGDTNWINNFTLSVTRETPSIVGYSLMAIWLLGIALMGLQLIKFFFHMHVLKQSALPLQNPKIRKLYRDCLREIHIKKEFQIYSTAFLKSPIIIGSLKPRIYLPIHLISDYNKTDMRYILLHELQHFKHKDSLIGYLMTLTGVIYWFNPLVQYALTEMRSDREIACDISVLTILNETEYNAYGNTLINFAQKFSSTPFPFAIGFGGSMKQMKRRITNIAHYKKPTFSKKIKGICVFVLASFILFILAPIVSTYAAENKHYKWKHSSANVFHVNLSEYFEEYDGSFVLYDSKSDAWCIHNIDHATLQVAPNSTYKIYDALFALEEGVITPKNSFLEWNGISYPFDAWNTNQTLQSAMSASVNWYFEALDKQLGTDTVYDYIQKIEYGNQDIRDDFPSYWLESSLKISPIEQVELLIKLYNNELSFSSENINAVKDSIFLFNSDAETFYGKTGTGRVNGQDVNGWFIGIIETADNTYFFATNIQADKNATGSKATKITMSILSDMNIEFLLH